MKIYKYRDLSKPEEGLERLRVILHDRAFWCAQVDTLNDPQEFAWTCDFVPSSVTVNLLAMLLVKTKRRNRDKALVSALQTVASGNLPAVGGRVVHSMIEQCRTSIGLACFGTTADNNTLWERYANRGEGVCIEVDVPDRLLGTQLHPVQYWDAKRIHIDMFLRSLDDRMAAQEVYTTSLLTKALRWQPEAEIRFISKKHSANVVIDESRITCLFLGDALPSRVVKHVRHIADSIMIANRHSHVAV